MRLTPEKREQLRRVFQSLLLMDGARLLDDFAELEAELAQSKADEQAARALLREPTISDKLVNQNVELLRRNRELEARLDYLEYGGEDE